MVVAALVFPVSGANAAGRDDQNNPDQNLLVDQEMTVNGTWTYKVVTITSMGFLTVPKGSTLNAQQIKLKNGSLKVDGGAIVISNITEGKALLSGTATDFTLINGAHITIKAPNGNSNIDFSQGGDAAVDVKASEAVKIAGATIECYAGNGFSNSVPWADHAPVGGYVAAGGNGTVRLGTSLTPVTDVSDLTVTIVGGNGGRAVNGQSWNGNFGGKGGGYSSGGPVSDYVGAGGKGILMVGGTELNIKNIKVSATGGKGGRAGDGGGIAKDSTVYAGSGGGGGYGGGNGGDLNSGGSNQAEDAGPVGDYVGSGGEVAIEFDASNLSVRGIDASAYGGRGGDAGNGGPGNFWGAGGGGGYGGGGGTYSAQWNGYNSNFKGGDGVVSGRVGAGGNITATFVGTNWVQVSNVTLTALAGDGGAAGNAGNAGNGYGGAGGGGGYGGGGGGAYYELGGDGKASGEVGAGGNITVSFIAGTADVMGSGPLGLFSSTFVLFGGSGGKAGAGGNGAGSYNYGSGGGGGYGGGGGGGYGSWNTGKAAGAGTAIDFVGSGGGAFVNFNSNSNPGELVARSNKFYIMGGSGGDGGPAGASGGQYSGGGGGGYAGAGGAYEWAAATATGTCLGSVGNGGDVNFTVFHVAPSISKLNSVSLYGGSGGNGKTQVGAGAHGGPGTGRKTATGVVGSQIPMGVPVLISPADGEIVNAIPPTLEWEHILFSSTDGDVISYSVQVDNHPDFSAPVVDTGVEMDSTFTPTTELALGGVYYWHVQATYLTGNTYGYGPARVFSFNTPPVLKKNIPLYTLWQDNMFNRGFHLINLSNYFTDDLFADQLSYQIIYETDPSHILGTVDGNFLSFTTPTMHWYGQERFAVRASDPLGLWANSNNFTVRVQHVNVPPSILPMPDISVTEGKEHFFDLTPYIIDPDSKLDQMVVSTNSSYIRVDGLGLYLNYTPGVLTQETVSITVNDTMDQSKATLIVNIEPFIAPPVIINPPPWTIVMTEDTEYTMELSGYAVDEKTNATDIVWNVTAVSAGNPPIFNSFILNKHTLKIVPAPNANGAGSLVLVAINQGGKEDSTTLYVTVTPVNDAPVIAKIPDVRILAGATRTIDLARFISDVDNSMSDLKLSSASPMVSVDGLKVTIFVKGDTVESQDMIPIAVSDGLDTTTGEFLVMIAFPPSLPQLIPTIKTTDDKVKEVDLKEYVLDKDTPEAALKWTVSGISDRYFSAYIDPNTHVLKISPKKAGKGEITLTVTDPDGGTASQLVAVQITATKKTTEIQSGVYVVVGFVIIAVVVGIALVIMRRRAGP
jgi:hypothetical protein